MFFIFLLNNTNRKWKDIVNVVFSCNNQLLQSRSQREWERRNVHRQNSTSHVADTWSVSFTLCSLCWIIVFVSNDRHLPLCHRAAVVLKGLKTLRHTVALGDMFLHYHKHTSFSLFWLRPTHSAPSCCPATPWMAPNFDPTNAPSLPVWVTSDKKTLGCWVKKFFVHWTSSIMTNTWRTVQNRDTYAKSHKIRKSAINAIIKLLSVSSGLSRFSKAWALMELPAADMLASTSAMTWSRAQSDWHVMTPVSFGLKWFLS